uniref:LECA THIOREDOXIN n=1 Tax=synthetic construct TaxID=32630 RepID=UPI00038A5F66|nr:Chain A, LECA THIOREDOXIN [synthetic construct]2YOI_B Chain B, LECA THIOREDOXIN [synthetic construct]
MVIQVTNKEEFEAILSEADKLVVVDFFATWCGPCKMIAPFFEELSEEYPDKVVFIKVDVDEVPDVAAKYGITSMPTFKFFKNGKKVDELVGANQEKLKQMILKHAP